MRNREMKSDAATKSTKLDGQSFIIIRQAGETGQLYGSVSARDIAEAITAAGFSVQRNHVALQQPIKTLGLPRSAVHLHPEVEANVTVNVARSPEQAERQAKGEDLTVREQTSMDDLGLEVGNALAEAGPGESLGSNLPNDAKADSEGTLSASRYARNLNSLTCRYTRSGRSTQSVKWRRFGESGKACGSRQSPACAP